jgi:hypothetical protein
MKVKPLRAITVGYNGSCKKYSLDSMTPFQELSSKHISSIDNIIANE